MVVEEVSVGGEIEVCVLWAPCDEEVDRREK